MQDDPYYYQGTQTLKNRFGVRDEAALEELEAAAYICRRTQPAPGFTPDLAGLKSVHRHLFEEIYEWAGKTRQEWVTIDGRSFWPSPTGLPREELTFWPAVLGKPFEERLLQSREAMDDLQRDGNLNWRMWAFNTTEQVATIYEARPFKCGNDQAMRRYVELAAEYYGLRVRIPGGQKLLEAAHTAAISGELHGLWSLLAYNTHATCLENEQNGSKPPESKAEQGESDRTTAMRAASAETAPLTSAFGTPAIEAIAKIRDPQRRAAAQKLLGGMYAAMAKALGYVQHQGPETPNPGRTGGDRGTDVNR